VPMRLGTRSVPTRSVSHPKHRPGGIMACRR